MKNTHGLARPLAFILSLMLLLGTIPALATEAEPLNEENLLIEMEAANIPGQLFLRHTTEHRHEETFSGGELFLTDDLYATAESVYYFFGEDYVCCITPTRFTDYYTSDGIAETLFTPEENAAELEFCQSYISI